MVVGILINKSIDEHFTLIYENNKFYLDKFCTDKNKTVRLANVDDLSDMLLGDNVIITTSFIKKKDKVIATISLDKMNSIWEVNVIGEHRNENSAMAIAISNLLNIINVGQRSEITDTVLHITDAVRKSGL